MYELAERCYDASLDQTDVPKSQMFDTRLPTSLRLSGNRNSRKITFAPVQYFLAESESEEIETSRYGCDSNREVFWSLVVVDEVSMDDRKLSVNVNGYCSLYRSAIRPRPWQALVPREEQRKRGRP